MDTIDIFARHTDRLSAGFPDKMVLLDCETTGGKATYHRITEIGLLAVEYGEIIQRWQTFLNPEQHIPPFIQRLTGITDETVKNAPVFADIADELLDILANRTLVAHNARFDHGFLKNEFQRVGKAFNSKPLCSVKVSRKLYPHFPKHGLSEIIRRFDFTIANRHRAMDDAEVIWQFFLQTSRLHEDNQIKAACDGLLKQVTLPMQLDRAEIDKLPNTAGVYYFYGANDQLLYVGKSVNIRDRVMSHFSQDYRNAKDLKMSALIANIDFETTPSDFGAQLRESAQIKALAPEYNRRLRKTSKLYQYQLAKNVNGFLAIRVAPVTQIIDASLSQQFGLFRSKRQAEKKLAELTEHYFLCQKYVGLDRSAKANDLTSACFGHQIKRCLGACCGEESAAAYNERVQLAMQQYKVQSWPWQGAILVQERDAPKRSQPHDDEGNAHWHIINEWRHVATMRDWDAVESYCRSQNLRIDRDHAMTSKPGSEQTNSISVVAHPADQFEKNTSEKSNPIEQDWNQVEFDLDTYLILIKFLLRPTELKKIALSIKPLKPSDIDNIDTFH